MMMKKHQQLVLSLLFLFAIAATSVVAANPPKLDCPSACKERCGKSWKNEMCIKMCNICCGKCSCVPPGTGQDTRHLCSCYDKMVNPKTGKPKCP